MSEFSKERCLSPIRLLVIESNDPGSTPIGEVLARSGSEPVEIERAASVAEAVQRLERGGIQVALLDLAAAGAEGLKVLAVLGKAAPEVALVVMTDSADESAALDAIRRGAQDTLIKGQAHHPVIQRTLRNAIERQAIRADLIRARASDHFLVTHDRLTLLLNRSEFRDQLHANLRRAVRDRIPLALLFIGIDRFKAVNVSLGRSAGDELLQEVATRLTESIRISDVVARVGSDEFVVMLHSVTREHGPAKTAQTLLESLARPYQISGREIWVTASMGIAVFPRDGKTPEALIRNAEAATVAAKAGGANRYHYYAEYMNKLTAERFETEERLRHAVEGEELLVYFQPQVDVSAGKIAGAEALMRWMDPRRGMIPPNDFIPIAEETGLIISMGEWILRAACEQATRWSQDIQVGVNVSSRQLARKGFSQVVARVLRETGLAPSRLDLEITESCILDTGGLTMATLISLRKLGVRISIDDFGTGYSSLIALKNLPIDGLKIDRAFVRNIPADQGDATITRALITMATGLGRTLIAEGVETREQMQFLYAEGCQLLQGYLFSKPIPAREFASHLEAEKAPWAEILEDLPI